jgi:hypothetical protein
MHGTSKAVGCNHLRLGNFSKLFPNLPTWAEDCGVTRQCDAEQVAAAIGGPGGLMHDTGNSSPDAEGIPAAYTFFAQFIDHDITLDTTTNLHGAPLANQAIGELPNLRSASLDLDCVYGMGPESMPFMYDHRQPGLMLVGNTVNGVHNPHDVPRNEEGRAMIGDPRNDENIFISQLQLLFLRFHNRLMVGRRFEEAQKLTRYHYQWIVLYDFLKRVCDPGVYNFALPKIEANARKAPSETKDYPFCTVTDQCHNITMPVEFSVAAYRFGHSLVRSQYPVNGKNRVIELFDERFGTLGFGQVPPELTVDWRFLLDVEPGHPYARSKAVDHLLADELIRLPNPIVGSTAPANDRSLAFRNVLRGYALGLPSGQQVAAALKGKGYTMIDPYQDLEFGNIAGWECAVRDLPCEVVKHTPLFFYLMREAGVIGECEHLGPVASAILLEVFGTMFVHCGTTFFKHRDKNGNPAPWAPLPEVSGDGQLTLADMARYVR